eukprot:5345202-Ditylum_brightwellii.AAC.1
MSGNSNFFFNLKPLPSTTHHTVALADDDTNLPECVFTIQSGSSWLEFRQFQVPCIIGTEDITVFGSPPLDEKILTPDFTYIASYNNPASNTNQVHLPPTPLPSLHAQTDSPSPELMSAMHSPSPHLCPATKQPPAHSPPSIAADNQHHDEHSIASSDDS